MNVIDPYRLAPAVPSFACDGVQFDGSTRMLFRTAAFTGDADSKAGIFSTWLRISSPALNDGNRFFSQQNASDAAIFLAGIDDGGSGFEGFGNLLFASPTTIMQMFPVKSNAPATLDSWHHFAMCWDFSTGDRSKTFALADGVSVKPASNTATNTNVPWSSAFSTFAIGGRRLPGGANVIDDIVVALAETYMAIGQYLDLSVAANLQKFRSSGGKPVSLGATGATPTGATPRFYLHLDDGEAAANFATNRAGKGNFSIAGALATASSSPSD